MKSKNGPLLFASALYIILMGSQATFAQDNGQKKAENKSQILGYIYTTTNGEDSNYVIQLARFADGTLGNEKTYNTGGKGGSDHRAPVHGDYDAQHQTKIIGDYLLTCNIGDNSIAVFRLDRKTGDLKFLANTPSGGSKPVSIGATPVSGSSTEYWVVVGNQWNNPTVIYDGDKLQRLPNDAFFKQDLSKPDPTDKERTVQLFKLNTMTGELRYESLIGEYNRQNGGPADVGFSPDGKKIAVTLWGVPHFLTSRPILKEMWPSRVYIYDFENGKVSNPRYFEESGISGCVGFSWSKNSEMLYVSSFSLIYEKKNQGLIILKDKKAKLTKIKTLITGIDGENDEACWTVISPDNKRLYVCSFVPGILGMYDIGTDDMITKNIAFAKRGDNAPQEDSKDLYITPDNKFIYMLGSLTSFTVNRFDVSPKGIKYSYQYNVDITKDKSGQTGVYDLGGIDGFDLK